MPPRDNLGPEPWREPDATPWLLLALGIAMAAVLLLAWLWRRRRAALRAGRAATAVVGLAAAEPTPRDRLVGLSESIREALTVQFGSSCRAKTTEELSTDDRLAQLLGDEGFRELIQFLDRIDRLKFAPERSGNHDALDEVLLTWEPRVASLNARIRVKPRSRPKVGASSRSRPSTRAVPTDPVTADSSRR